MNARSYGIRRCKRHATMANRMDGMRCRGYTLLEMGFVIAVMGMLILLTATHFANHIRSNDAQVADEIVQDVWSIIHATRLWVSRHGRWPHVGGIISLEPLGPSGARYLATMPTTPVTVNQNGCGSQGTARKNGKYDAIGWNRASKGGNAFLINADDMVIRFCVEGDRQFADSIASRIPFGYVESSGTNYQTNLQEFDIETRLLGGQASRSSLYYVRHTGEDRPVVAKKIKLHQLQLATSDDSGTGKTRVRLNARMDVDAGIGGASSYSNTDRAYFELERTADAHLTFSKAIPSWNIHDWTGSTNYHGVWMPIGFDGEAIGAGTTYTPSASMEVKRAGTTVNDMAWTLQYLYKDGNDKPATFDLYLADKDADSSDSNAYDCHRGIHTQLCKIERQVHDFLHGATFKLGNTPDYVLSGLEDAACRSYPTTCP